MKWKLLAASIGGAIIGFSGAVFMHNLLAAYQTSHTEHGLAGSCMLV